MNLKKSAPKKINLNLERFCMMIVMPIFMSYSFYFSLDIYNSLVITMDKMESKMMNKVENIMTNMENSLMNKMNEWKIEVKAEMKTEMNEMKTEMKTEMNEIKGNISDVKNTVSSLAASMITVGEKNNIIDIAKYSTFAISTVVHALNRPTRIRTGTGFLLNTHNYARYTDQLLLVTNTHVILDCKELSLYSNYKVTARNKYFGTLVCTSYISLLPCYDENATDKFSTVHQDVAVLRCTPPANTKMMLSINDIISHGVNFTNNTSVPYSTPVVSVGYVDCIPYVQSYPTNSITVVIPLDKDRYCKTLRVYTTETTLSIGGSTGKTCGITIPKEDYIYKESVDTSPAYVKDEIPAGSSGGPIFTKNGHVIGINHGRADGGVFLYLDSVIEILNTATLNDWVPFLDDPMIALAWTWWT